MPPVPFSRPRGTGETGAKVVPFLCSICEQESTRICGFCTKDTCSNHLCERCGGCSDCCECDVPLDEPSMVHPRLSALPTPPDAPPEQPHVAPDPDLAPPDEPLPEPFERSGF
jgi:hypothetical protein